MRKTHLICIMLLAGSFLFAANSHNHDSSKVFISVTEFGYPIIPNASQAKFRIPISLETGSNEFADFEITTWYRAISPYFIPDVFYEVGVVTSYNVLNRLKSDLYFGVGTAFSQNKDSTSIPLIMPIEYRYNPIKYIGLNIAMQTMFYGEGILSELTVATLSFPFSRNMYLKIGCSANAAYSWVEEVFEYSYGLLYGLGYRF